MGGAHGCRPAPPPERAARRWRTKLPPCAPAPVPRVGAARAPPQVPAAGVRWLPALAAGVPTHASARDGKSGRGAPDRPPEIVERTAEAYQHAYRQLTGSAPA